MDNSVDSPLVLVEVADKQPLTKKTWEEAKKIARISLPTVVFRVTSYGVIVITQSMIGHISSVDLAAYALVQSISMQLVNGIVLGMSSATETLCGQAFGAKQYHMMGVYLQRSWIINFVTVTILIPIMAFVKPIYELLGEDDNIAEAAGVISDWFIPFQYTFVFVLTIQMFLQSQMKNAIYSYISLAFFIVHVVVSWLFVYKLNLRIPGAMGALIFSQWGLVIGGWIYIFGGWCRETWTGFSKLAFVDLLPVVKLSISSGFMLLFELWYTSVLVLIAGYSNDAVVEIFAFSICVRVSNELGRGNAEAARFAIKLLLGMAAALGIFFCIIVVVFGHSYPYLFTRDEDVAEAAGNLSVLLALTMLVSSFQAVFSGVAIGCGSQAKVAVVNVISYYLIGVPVGCVFVFVADLGVKGLWIGMLIGMVVQVTALVVITWRIDWKEEVRSRATKGETQPMHTFGRNFSYEPTKLNIRFAGKQDE